MVFVFSNVYFQALKLVVGTGGSHHQLIDAGHYAYGVGGRIPILESLAGEVYLDGLSLTCLQVDAGIATQSL